MLVTSPNPKKGDETYLEMAKNVSIVTLTAPSNFSAGSAREGIMEGVSIKFEKRSLRWYEFICELSSVRELWRL